MLYDLMGHPSKLRTVLVISIEKWNQSFGLAKHLDNGNDNDLTSQTALLGYTVEGYR
jgi:hypothetical protein